MTSQSNCLCAIQMVAFVFLSCSVAQMSGDESSSSSSTLRRLPPEVGGVSKATKAAARRHPRHTPFLPGDYWKGMRPDFGDTETEVRVMLNGTARMKCPISHVADSRISFVRRKDFHILSNGHTVFTADQRFQVIHKAKSIDWILQLENAGYNDSGIYECQISGSSGSHSLVFELEVMTPKARIFVGGSGGVSRRSKGGGRPDGPDFHLLKGSTISLTCVVDQTPSPPQFVFWYHGSRMINHEDVKGGESGRTTVNNHILHRAAATASVNTIISNSGNRSTTSTLTIDSANPKLHSGNYTCKPSNAVEASIHLFVSEDRQSEPLKRPGAKDHTSNFGLPATSDGGGSIDSTGYSLSANNELHTKSSNTLFTSDSSTSTAATYVVICGKPFHHVLCLLVWLLLTKSSNFVQYF